MFNHHRYFQSPKNHTLRKGEPKYIPEAPKAPRRRPRVRVIKKTTQTNTAHPTHKPHTNRPRKHIKKRNQRASNSIQLRRNHMLALLFLGLIACAGVVEACNKDAPPPKKTDLKKEIAEICRGERSHIHPANKMQRMRLGLSDDDRWMPETCLKNRTSSACRDQLDQHSRYTGISYREIDEPGFFASIGAYFRNYQLGINRANMASRARSIHKAQSAEENTILASTSTGSAEYFATKDMLSNLHRLQADRVVSDVMNSWYSSSYGNCDESASHAAIQIRDVASSHNVHINVTRILFEKYSDRNSRLGIPENTHVALLVNDARPKTFIHFDHKKITNFMLATNGYLCDPWNNLFVKISELGSLLSFYIKQWSRMTADPLRLSYTGEPLLSSSAISFFSRKVDEIGLRLSDDLRVLDLDKEEENQCTTSSEFSFNS